MTFQVSDDHYPGTAIAYIEAQWGDRVLAGSGVLVGRNDVLTASHLIYNASLGGLAEQIRVYFSFEPGEPGAVAHSPLQLRYHATHSLDGSGLIPSGDGAGATLAHGELDIALLSIPAPVGDRQGWFGFSGGFPGGPVGVLGHPALYGHRLMFDDGSIRRDPLENLFWVNADLEINPGNSGGPIYYDHGGGPFVVGVVSTRSFAAAVDRHLGWIQAEMGVNDRFLTPGEDVFRFYNTGSGAHFYTGSAEEAYDVALSMPGLRFEGTAFSTSADAASGVGVHRFYRPSSGSHFYTASAEEAAWLRAEPGFRHEGISHYAHGEAGAGRDAVFRFHNTERGVHFYTTSAAERDSIVQALPQYRYEGIAYYVDAVA